MARRPRRKAEETREDILSMAETLFRQQGYARIAIADIAAALDMSPANVFKHFHSKTVLADAIAQRHIRRFTDRLSSIDDTISPPQRLLKVAECLMESHLSDLRENPYIFEMVLMTAESDLPCARIYRQVLEEKFASIIRNGVDAGIFYCGDPEKMAATVRDALISVLHPVHLAHSEPAELPERCRNIVGLINTALQNPLAK